MSFGRDRGDEDWAEFLDPNKVRANLIRTSVYLTAYEILCQALIDQPKGFFAVDFSDDGPIQSEDYQRHVLSLDKMPYFASARWFQEMGALNDVDIDRLSAIRAHRNRLAHETPNIIFSSGSGVSLENLRAIVELVSKIDMWWIREIEIPVNPEFDGQPVDDLMSVGTFSGRMWILDLIVDLIHADGEKLVQAFDILRQHIQNDDLSDVN